MHVPILAAITGEWGAARMSNSALDSILSSRQMFERGPMALAVGWGGWARRRPGGRIAAQSVGSR